jgi:hypothetical protein
MNRSFTAAVLIAATTCAARAADPLDRPVIGHQSFTYLGAFRLPTSANGWSTAFSAGGLALRHVGGHLQFFTTSHVYSGGLVYEIDDPGLSATAPYPLASVVHEWGDVYDGHKWVGNDGGSSALSSGVLTNGLFFDEASSRLYWSYGHWYNTSNPFNPSLGFSLIDDAHGTATGVGAWSVDPRPEKFARGGSLRIPQWFADRFTGGKTLGAGFGGYYSIISSGSLGPSLCAVADPDPATAPDRSALANVPLLGFPTNGPGAQRPGDYINREPSGPFTGTIAGATSTSVTVDYILRATGVLADSTIEITDGPGAGQSRDLTSWDYQSQTASVSPAWTTLPVSGQSSYRIVGGYARGGSATTIQLKAATTSHDYTGLYLIITAGTGAGQAERAITAWNQSTQTATVSPAWGTVPDTTSRYEYYGPGVATSDPHDGLGTWTWKDAIGGAAWIDLPERQGLLVLAQLGRGHVWYEASDIRCDGQYLEWFVYDPNDLAAVAAGSKAQNDVRPAAMWEDTVAVGDDGAVANFGGAAFDSTTNRLYVLVEGVRHEGVEWYPQMYVYQVDGSISPTSGGTTGGTSTSGGSTTSGGSATSGGAAGGGDGGHPSRGCGLGGLTALLGLLLLARQRWLR